MRLPSIKHNDLLAGVLFLIFLLGIIAWIAITFLMNVLPAGEFLFT